jgi:hypothetical protein
MLNLIAMTISKALNGWKILSQMPFCFNNRCDVSSDKKKKLSEDGESGKV